MSNQSSLEMVSRISPKTFDSSLCATSLTPIKSLELGGSGLEATSNSGRLRCITARGYGELVDTDDLRTDERPVSESRTIGKTRLIFGITGGRDVVEMMLQRGWFEEERASLLEKEAVMSTFWKEAALAFWVEEVGCEAIDRKKRVTRSGMEEIGARNGGWKSVENCKKVEKLRGFWKREVENEEEGWFKWGFGRMERASGSRHDIIAHWIGLTHICVAGARLRVPSNLTI